MAQKLRALIALQSSTPSTHLTVYNSSFRKSHIQFWLPKAPGTQGMYSQLHMKAKYHTHEQKQIRRPKEMDFINYSKNTCAYDLSFNSLLPMQPLQRLKITLKRTLSSFPPRKFSTSCRTQILFQAFQNFQKILLKSNLFHYRYNSPLVAVPPKHVFAQQNNQLKLNYSELSSVQSQK